MKKESLKERAYRIIKTKIVNCEYAPASFLNELSLMAEIGASRTPIREAMSKLEIEHLVKIVPKKGVIVSNIALSEINEVYQVRELVEPFIIRTWGGDIDPRKLEYYQLQLQRLAEAGSDAKKIHLDDSLHRLIIGRCQNRFLVQLLDMVYDQTHRIRIISGKLTRRLDDTRTEHLRIIELLLEKQLDAAADAMALHLKNSKRAAFDSLYQTS